MSRPRLLTRATWFAMALLIVRLFVHSTATAASAPSAKIDYRLPKSTTLGEPAIMTVTLFNTTGYRVTADFGIDDQTQFVFRHTKPDGTFATLTPSIPSSTRGRTSRLMLRGNTHTASVVLDEWLNLSQVGRHVIDVEFRGAVGIEGGTPVDLKRRAQLAIEVRPRDGARLQKRATEWLKQISTLSPGTDARTASTALLVMTDPVAIPFLELAATRTRDQKFADALATRRDPDARTSLDRLARSTDPDVRAIAQRALSKSKG